MILDQRPKACTDLVNVIRFVTVLDVVTLGVIQVRQSKLFDVQIRNAFWLAIAVNLIGNLAIAYFSRLYGEPYGPR